MCSIGGTTPETACLEYDARYGVGKFERGGGGSYFWKGGSRKGGFGRTPRTPPGYGPGKQGQIEVVPCEKAFVGLG